MLVWFTVKKLKTIENLTIEDINEWLNLNEEDKLDPVLSNILSYRMYKFYNEFF